MHISRELLLGCLTGRLSPKELSQLRHEHLLECCPTCAREFQAFQQQLQPSSEGATAAQLTTAMATALHRFDQERLQAERWWRQLAELPPEAQRKRVVRARKRFRGHLFASLLLEEARRLKVNDPRGSLHYAELAELAMTHSPTVSKEVIALALALQGNACRALADFPTAQARFREARALCEGVIDLAVVAEIDNLNGSLCLDLRDFKEAERLFVRSLRCARALGDEREIVANLIALAASRYYAQDEHRAVSLARKALVRAARCGDDKLLLVSTHNLALYLTATEEYQEAFRLLNEAVGQYQRMAGEAPSWLNLFDWLAGKIALGLGDFERAEMLLLQVEARFRQKQHLYDVALVGLDLAMLYIKRRRLADLCARAVEVMALLERYGLYPEAARLVRAFSMLAAEKQR